MPIYEYRCAACGHYLDALQKINDPPLTDCPDCSKTALKRLISAPSFRLKGGGWYETDFKSDKERRRNLADGAGTDGGGKSDAGDSGSGTDKSDKSDKPDKSDKSAKSEKSEKSGKGGASGDSGKSSGAGASGGKSSSSGSKGSGSEAA